MTESLTCKRCGKNVEYYDNHFQLKSDVEDVYHVSCRHLAILHDGLDDSDYVVIFEGRQPSGHTDTAPL